MKIQFSILGLIAMAASPFLFIEMYILQNKEQNTSAGGICDLIYMIGWTYSIVGLLRLQATGEKSGKIFLYVQLAILTIANIWNTWTIADPNTKSTLYFILDFSWPLSNVCLLIVGIVVALKGKLQSWKRYSALGAGLWLPISILLMVVLGDSNLSYLLPGIYSTISFFTLGFMIYSFAKEKGTLALNA